VQKAIKFLTMTGFKGSGSTHFCPLDTVTYVTDTYNHCVQVLNSDFTFRKRAVADLEFGVPFEKKSPINTPIFLGEFWNNRRTP
jgi:hypothetical protein